MPDDLLDYENMARKLEASGNYRVQRKLVKPEFRKETVLNNKIGIILDIETTGLDPHADEIIEIGLVKFSFLESGHIVGPIDALQGLFQPKIALPPEVSQLTGINNEMLVGQNLDLEKIRDFIQDASIIIAHNASFDRRFCEKKWPFFAAKEWACSLKEINWREEGFSSSHLNVLLNNYGFFHGGHRALNDCYALLKILTLELPISHKNIFSTLLKSSIKPTIRISAVGSPFETKDVLKKRGYKWSDGGDDSPRAWWIDVSEDAAQSEISFLRKEIYRREVDIPTKKLTAFERYSEREAINK